MLSFFCIWFAVSFIAGLPLARWVGSGWKMLERDWLEAKRTGQ